MKPVMLVVFLGINLAGMFLAATDKRRARKNRWRIPEKWFFLLSLAGGAPGVYAGLLLFRHKTRHWYFMWGIPGIFVLQSILVFYLIKNGFLSLISMP